MSDKPVVKKIVKPVFKKVRQEEDEVKKDDYVLQRRVIPEKVEEKDKYSYAVISLRRTAKTMEGGKRLRFSALVAIGDKNGKLGIALCKAPNPHSAIEKAKKKAKKNLINVLLINGTIPYSFEKKFKAAYIFVRPAKPGTGIIAGRTLRTLFELAGVKNVCSKVYGARNSITNAYCLYYGLMELKDVKDIKKVKEENYNKEN
uniref:Small ribosomal subunit protein uS5 n=1 Tax=candidate division CPR3 bacterium TaxID=2268181 RepID=A0A7C5YR83_UNCC3